MAINFKPINEVPEIESLSDGDKILVNSNGEARQIAASKVGGSGGGSGGGAGSAPVVGAVSIALQLPEASGTAIGTVYPIDAGLPDGYDGLYSFEEFLNIIRAGGMPAFEAHIMSEGSETGEVFLLNVLKLVPVEEAKAMQGLFILEQAVFQDCVIIFRDTEMNFD